MPEIAVVNFMTGDGVIQSPLFVDEDREGGFHAGGWVQPYMDEAIGQVMAEATTGAGALLLGRKTYQTFAASWSSADQREPAVAALNRIPKYVASTTLATADWHNSRILGDDVTADVARLKQQPGADIVVFGSSHLLRTLVAADLVDRYTLLIFPLLLGTGKKMFSDGIPPTTLMLLSTQSSTSGVVILRYARRPTE